MSEESNWQAHRQLFGGMVTAEHMALVRRFRPERLKAAYEADKHLNGIPLATWDRLGLQISGYWHLSQSERVCILKEAARQLVEAENGTESG